ncbi:DUF6998 domain-containing protein [Nonlabens xiamenensis]|uniref:DUF6998 domain-containing protein n=1 Tax=Nonlabens xiamenensis TaxID=2341043 RepID=UPI000F6113DD|nr:hypothetical protein [Nonlabens xiamenensis]
MEQIAKSIKSLKEKGIIRSNNLVGDLGEYYCSKYLGIELCNNKVQKGFDGKDNTGQTVQIKTRKKPKGNAVINFKNLQFDYCIFIELDNQFKVVLALKIFNTEISSNICEKRNRISINKLKNITKKVVLLSEPRYKMS